MISADAASAVRADTRVAARRNRTHGALMLAGFSAMLAGSVAAFLGKAFAEETREDEKTKTRRQTRRQTAMENETRDATENETANEGRGHDEERAEAETKETETREPPWKLHAHKLASVLGSAWIHAHRASQIAGATLALAGFAVALTREETETRAPFEWGSYTFDGDEETAAAERAAVAHGVVGASSPRVAAAVPALAAWRANPKRRRRKIRPKRRLRGRFATRTSSSGGSPPSSGWPTASSGRGSRGGEARTRARRDSSSLAAIRRSRAALEAWRSSPR